MTITVVHHVSETEWHRFVDCQPGGNIFHTPEMFDVFSRAKGHRPVLWAAINQDGRILALLLPVQISVLGGVLRLLTTRAIAYGSVLWEQNDEGKQALSVLLDAYKRRIDGMPLFTEFRNLSITDDVQPILQENHFVYEAHLNYLIDLNLPADAVFQNIGRRTRKNIRHALNRGDVFIEEVKDRGQVSVCYELIKTTYRAVHVPLGDLSLFEAAFDVLYPKDMIRFVLAYVKGVPVATSVELLYKDVVYGWYSGLDRSYGNYVPNELLMWNILQWGSGKGYRIYDFGGAGKPNEKYGVREFKAKFGGTLVCFGRNTFVHFPLVLRLSSSGYGLLRRFL